jgi:hypothetical protein
VIDNLWYEIANLLGVVHRWKVNHRFSTTYHCVCGHYPSPCFIFKTCVRRKPQNARMLERSEGLADWTKHHIQEIEGISPHISGRSSGQSTQLGHLSHLESQYRSRSQKTETTSRVDMWKLCRVDFSWRRRQNSVSETLRVLNKNKTMDNVQKHSYCINTPSSQTSRSHQLKDSRTGNENLQEAVNILETNVEVSELQLHEDSSNYTIICINQEFCSVSVTPKRNITCRARDAYKQRN